MLHADEANGRTVMMKLTVALRNFANAPKKAPVIERAVNLLTLKQKNANLLHAQSC